MDVTQLPTRTAPYSPALHDQTKCFHIRPDCALNLNPMSAPLLVAVNFVGCKHWSVILQNAYNCSFEQPTFGGVQESAVIRAFKEQVLPDYDALEIIAHGVGIIFLRAASRLLIAGAIVQRVL